MWVTSPCIMSLSNVIWSTWTSVSALWSDEFPWILPLIFIIVFFIIKKIIFFIIQKIILLKRLFIQQLLMSVYIMQITLLNRRYYHHKFEVLLDTWYNRLLFQRWHFHIFVLYLFFFHSKCVEVTFLTHGVLVDLIL